MTDSTESQITCPAIKTDLQGSYVCVRVDEHRADYGSDDEGHRWAALQGLARSGPIPGWTYIGNSGSAKLWIKP